MPEMFNQEIIERPWGNYYRLFQESGVWVKRVEVNPDCRISLQKHLKRSEKWIIVKGTGLAIVNSNETLVQAGSVIDVPLQAVHRIGNQGKEPLIFIEVATGSYLGEDDIERLQDDFHRPE